MTMASYRSKSAVACVMALATVLAQNEPPKQPERAEQSRGTGTEADRILASWLQVGTNNEVELAKIAQQRSQNAQIKDFAQKLTKDHGEFSQKLQPYADAAPMPGGRPVDPASKPSDASADRMGQFNHIALVKELGQQCFASAKRELESKTGEEFDRCFVGMQVIGHMQALDMLQVFQRHASERLRSTLQQGEQTVLAHLQQAKQLCKQIEMAGDGDGKK